MALIDLATVRAQVRFLGDYQNKQRFPDVDVNREIQKAFRKMYSIVDGKHQGWWDTEATLTTTANIAFVALAPDMWRIRGVDLLDGTEYFALRRVTIDDRNKFGTTTDQPSAHRLSARGVELYATPDAAYTLRITYAPKAPDLAEAASREWFNGWEDYVVQCTLAELDRREGRPSLNDRLTAMKLAQDLLEADSGSRDEQEPEYLPLREDGDFLLPRDRGIF